VCRHRVRDKVGDLCEVVLCGADCLEERRDNVLCLNANLRFANQLCQQQDA